MNIPSAMSHDLIRVNEANIVRATRFTWQHATTQRRPGRWLVDWFRRHLPSTRRLAHFVAGDALASPSDNSAALRITVEPCTRTDVGADGELLVHADDRTAVPNVMANP
jgi:hypothetical protein